MTQKIIMTIDDGKLAVDYEPLLPTIDEYKKLNNEEKETIDLIYTVVRRAVHIFNEVKQ